MGSQGPLLLVAHSLRCPFSRQLLPLLPALAAAHPGLRVATIERANASQFLLSRLAVFSFPTLLVQARGASRQARERGRALGVWAFRGSKKGGTHSPSLWLWCLRAPLELA